MKTCWICGGEFPKDWPMQSDNYDIDCRTCGAYFISGSLNASKFPLPDAERYRFSYWCKQRQLDGRDPPKIDDNNIAAIVAQLENPRPSSKADLLLISLSKLYPVPGSHVKSLDTFREYSLACARDGNELSYFLGVLLRRGLLKKAPGRDKERIEITEDGWDRVEVLSQTTASESKFAFVAMRFSDDMLPLWKLSFSPAITDAGFEPLLANDPAHNERIDARIVSDIKRSRFLVADVTHKSPGVYFEAGYALVLDKRVIWTCRDDHQTDMHFDIRQYNHILWKDSDDLRSQLYYRIRATI
jgi:nucleoside 2-deoxyribosyltransferase